MSTPYIACSEYNSSTIKMSWDCGPTSGVDSEHPDTSLCNLPHPHTSHWLTAVFHISSAFRTLLVLRLIS
ncbi:unnamed protein product, partial [Ectocarpus sp. 8 AP-2014]